MNYLRDLGELFNDGCDRVSGELVDPVFIRSDFFTCSFESIGNDFCQKLKKSKTF